MTDFELTPRDYPHLGEVLLSTLPEFAVSPEYNRLTEHDRVLPTVVCGAFARYVSRLLLRRQGAEDLLEASFGMMERLARSPDPEVQNALVVEVFEHIDLPVGQREQFRRRLGPAAGSLYDRWVSD